MDVVNSSDVASLFLQDTLEGSSAVRIRNPCRRSHVCETLRMPFCNAGTFYAARQKLSCDEIDLACAAYRAAEDEEWPTSLA